MGKYEIMFILPPDLGEEGTEKEIKEIHKTVAEEKGEVLEEDRWGIREFEYRIKKEEEGFYGVLIFSMDPKKLGEFEKALNLNQKVLRFLITKVEDEYALKKYEEYSKEWELEEKKEEEEKKTSRDEKKPKKKAEPRKSEPRKAAVAPAPAPAEKPKKSASEEKEAKPKVEKAEEPKSSENDIDNKLKSIIDDPDISL